MPSVSSTARSLRGALALAVLLAGCAKTGNGSDGGADLSGSAACVDDSGCSAGKHCDGATGLCVTCVTDGPCGPGLLCDAPGHRCVEGCSASHPCAAGTVCD